MLSFDISPQTVSELLRKAGMEGEFTCERLAGGTNNRVHRLRIGSRSFLLKVYFQHPDDPRDRLGAEFTFCTFAWDNGLRWTPQPLAADPVKRMGLYEFVDGRQLLPGEVTEEVVAQALEFFCQLNAHRTSASAERIPPASEACFSISDHLACVERRLQRLLKMHVRSGVDKDALRFVRTVLQPKWQRLVDSVHHKAGRIGMELDGEISPADRCISPSDFGFHNALLQADGRLRFIDFEYAGWDDPAKMLCDFFCQPAVPVPMELSGSFIRHALENISRADIHSRRTHILFPVYIIKWCTILLNDFLPVGDQRRTFSSSEDNPDERKNTQLQKARQKLHMKGFPP